MTKTVFQEFAANHPEYFLLIHPPSVLKLGSVEAGLFWTRLIDEYYKRIYEIADDWLPLSDKDAADLAWTSKYRIRETRNKLKQMGLIETKVMKHDGVPTMHYKMVIKKVAEFLANSM